MNILLAIISAITFSLYGISARAFQLRVDKSERGLKLFGALACAVGAAAYLLFAIIFSGEELYISFAGILLAIVFGVFFALASLCSVRAFSIGSMSVTSIIVNASVIIPLLFSIMALNEGITVWQTVGICFLMLTFLSSALGGDKNNEKQFSKWVVLVAIAFLSNGSTAVLQKVYKLALSNESGNLFMALSYGTAALIFALAFLFDKALKKEKLDKRSCIVFFFLMLLGGLGSFGGNLILMMLSIRLPASVLYPIVNGGLCLITTAASCLLFKEKLTAGKALTIAFGVLTIITLNL